MSAPRCAGRNGGDYHRTGCDNSLLAEGHAFADEGVRAEESPAADKDGICPHMERAAPRGNPPRNGLGNFEGLSEHGRKTEGNSSTRGNPVQPPSRCDAGRRVAPGLQVC